MRTSISLALLCLLSTTTSSAASKHFNLVDAVATQTRRWLNLGNILGSVTNAPTPYDRVTGYPVFQVTTAWGSAYMSMEKKNDMMGGIDQSATGELESISEEQNQYRTVCLYFMDPDDALSVRTELNQMEQMKEADIRITSCSLAKALRQASNLGQGLLTGAPIDPLTGNVKPVEEGGSLRYKIMPPKRQLFYAARCIGKERVGLFGENPVEDAVTAVMGNSAIESANLRRLRDARDRTREKQRTPMEQANMHMEGHVGIPVFYCPQMHRRQPILKQVLSGCGKEEIPLFFNYEDLQMAWSKLRRSNKSLPEKAPSVEVFNLWDVLTSMDKEAWRGKKTGDKPQDWRKPWIKRLSTISSQSTIDLDAITFVPSSDCINYKQSITKQGNSKARLRPMR